MSQLYDDLCEQFHNGDLTEEDLPSIGNYPMDFCKYVSHGDRGDVDFDRFVMRQFLKERVKRVRAMPKNTMKLNVIALEPNRSEFYLK